MKTNSEIGIEFLKNLRPDGTWLLVAIDPDGGNIVAKSFTPSQITLTKKWIESQNEKRNVYFTVNSIKSPMDRKSKKSDILSMDYLHIDMDPDPNKDIKEERERILNKLNEFDPKPSCIIDSGGGYQALWKLKSPVPIDKQQSADRLEAYNVQLEILLTADSCHNIDRILRLPGTINIPGERKKKKGREVSQSGLIFFEELVYDLSNFTPAQKIQDMNGFNIEGVELGGYLPPVYLDSIQDMKGETKELITEGLIKSKPTRYESRSEALFAAVCELVRLGCNDETIGSIILDPHYVISSSVREQKRPKEYAARQIARARFYVEDPALLELNEKHAVIEDMAGKCRIISEYRDDVMKRTKINNQTFGDFKNRYCHKKVEVGSDDKGNPKYKSLGDWWIANRLRRQYLYMSFAPNYNSPNMFNLWRGFSCEAIPGDCSLFLNHIKDNICRGNKEYYEYLINWMARTVQYPERGGEVAIVLRGRQGTGKGAFVKSFGSLWGHHFVQVLHSEHITGKFNKHLRDCCVLFGDEAFASGSKKDEGVLKGLVTEDFQLSESKGVDAEATKNYVKVILASNSNWVVPAGAEERRFFVLDIGDDNIQNFNYFRKMREQFENGGREAFLHHLLKTDITKFEVRSIPSTDALYDQKINSLSPERSWWFDVLNEGRIHIQDQTFNWGNEIQKDILYRSYLFNTQSLNLSKSSSLSREKFGRFLNEVCSEISTKQKSENSVRRYYYILPSLETARGHWDKLYGKRTWIEVDLSDDSSIEESPI